LASPRAAVANIPRYIVEMPGFTDISFTDGLTPTEIDRLLWRIAKKHDIIIGTTLRRDEIVEDVSALWDWEAINEYLIAEKAAMPILHAVNKYFEEAILHNDEVAKELGIADEELEEVKSEDMEKEEGLATVLKKAAGPQGVACAGAGAPSPLEGVNGPGGPVSYEHVRFSDDVITLA
jgi:hypothetical protein